MEILFAVAFIGIAAGIFMMMENRSWMRTKNSRDLLNAGQLIEKHIEALRMDIAGDPDNRFPPGDVTFTEKGITLERTIGEARSPSDNAVLPNVRKLDLVASWGNNVGDTLIITTYISKNF